jgi:UDP-N-acetylmuramoyl-L-alanyl-D-glutamate--2,6-diaminopimelate ligase
MWQRIKNFYHLLAAVLFVLLCRFPARKLTVIGVTGTDGKTTTTNLIFYILKKAGKKVSMISSVKAVIGSKEYDTGFHVTTPSPKDIQKYLRQAVLAGCRYFVLESTSHGLSQNRLWGCRFYLGVVTNVTREHLDYHRTYENYLKAKSKLFDKVKIAVLNRDDESYNYLNSKLQITNSKVVTYGIKNEADFTPRTFPFKTKLLGEYNQYNCLAAIAVTSLLGIPQEKIREAVANFSGVKGRVEEIKEGQNFRVFVDFAHTPNGLENILKTLKSQIKDKALIVVFGSAGLRDKGKRPFMGEIASKYADLIVLTAEDPRTEDVNQIIEEIAQGCFKQGVKEMSPDHFETLTPQTKEKYFFRIPDRKEAIKFAIQKLAHQGDIVVTCGKGHEKSMCYGKKEYPWDEYQVIKRALRGRSN